MAKAIITPTNVVLVKKLKCNLCSKKGHVEKVCIKSRVFLFPGFPGRKSDNFVKKKIMSYATLIR